MDSLFGYHTLNERGKHLANHVGLEFDTLLHNLRLICPENTREFSLTKTKLEEACFYAKKSIALQTENQDKSIERLRSQTEV